MELRQGDPGRYEACTPWEKEEKYGGCLRGRRQLSPGGSGPASLPPRSAGDYPALCLCLSSTPLPGCGEAKEMWAGRGLGNGKNRSFTGGLWDRARKQGWESPQGHSSWVGRVQGPSRSRVPTAPCPSARAAQRGRGWAGVPKAKPVSSGGCSMELLLVFLLSCTRRGGRSQEPLLKKPFR